MGFNSTIVIMNDWLYDIENDPNFGKKVSRAIGEFNYPEDKREYTSGFKVVDCQHADCASVIATSWNNGQVLGRVFLGSPRDEDYELKILKELAGRKGYRLVKKSERKKK